MTAILTTSVLTCPECAHTETLEMPTDACVFFHECASCAVILRPRAGDCCVCCSYGSVPCRSRETGLTDCCIADRGESAPLFTPLSGRPKIISPTLHVADSGRVVDAGLPLSTTGSMPAEGAIVNRPALVRRGLGLNYVSFGYNVLEAGATLFLGVASGSVALVGFGVDSVIEVTSSIAAQWRLRADLEPTHRERVEHITLRVIGWCFLGLACYVVVESLGSLWLREQPERSVAGIVILALSVVIMPLLAQAKRRVARAMKSGALEADARQTSLCAYLSAIALTGVALNALFGWWWADPAAALLMVPIIAKEGIDGLRGDATCDACT